MEKKEKVITKERMTNGRENEDYLSSVVGSNSLWGPEREQVWCLTVKRRELDRLTDVFSFALGKISITDKITLLEKLGKG